MNIQNELREKIQKEALQELIKHNRRTAAISMRVGKTLIGIRVAHHTYQDLVFRKEPKILIVAPKLSIFDGWKEDLDKFNYQYLKDHITYCTYVSFAKQDLSKYDLIIFDECHSLKLSHVGKDHKMDDHGLKLGQYKGDILGLTGTPPTDIYSEKARMIEAYCPIVYTYETEDAISGEILNDYRIIVHMLPLSLKKDIHVKTGKWDFMTSERGSYTSLTKKIDEMEAWRKKDKQWAAINRMKQMQGFQTKIDYAKNLVNQLDDKCLVFTNTKEQAKEICNHSYYSGNTANEANLQLFKAGVIDQMSCVHQLSEGQTIPGLKASIILHAYGNEFKFSQRFARCLSLTSDDMANIHVLCYKDTIDEEWVKKAFAALDPAKIRYIEF